MHVGPWHGGSGSSEQTIDYLQSTWIIDGGEAALFQLLDLVIQPTRGARLPAHGCLAVLGSQRSAYGSSTWASAMMKYSTQEHSSMHGFAHLASMEEQSSYKDRTGGKTSKARPRPRCSEHLTGRFTLPTQWFLKCYLLLLQLRCCLSTPRHRLSSV